MTLISLGGIIAGLGSLFYIIFKMASTDHSTLEVVIDHTDEPIAPPVSAETPATAPITPKVLLSTFCAGIAQFEGANPANKNPGNCRCSPVGYLPKYGRVLCNPKGFAVFPTITLGTLYLNELVHHRLVLHPTWNFYDFFSNYAPSTDGNNPKHYAEWIANYCKVVPTTILSTLLT